MVNLAALLLLYLIHVDGSNRLIFFLILSRQTSTSIFNFIYYLTKENTNGCFPQIAFTSRGGKRQKREGYHYSLSNLNTKKRKMVVKKWQKLENAKLTLFGNTCFTLYSTLMWLLAMVVLVVSSIRHSAGERIVILGFLFIVFFV